MTNSTIRVATDVGGTFTDLVCFEFDNTTGFSKVRTAKSATTPPDYETGMINVIRKAEVDLSQVNFLAHGTTVVINALTERKGVKVGLITTQGFRDTLEIARGNRPDFFNLHYEKPPPFVPRFLRQELPGRMTYKGEEMRPLILDGLSDILNNFKTEGVEAIAISFLHSYANPAHEQATEAEIRKLWPEVRVVSSHSIVREWREYERTNTAVLSAYVQPVAEGYLKRLAEKLKHYGFSGSPYVMQSNCGVDTLEATAKTPITMIESGPSSGIWGAAELGKLIGDLNVLALDIGGTTAKCSLIENGNIKIVTDYWIEKSRKSSGYPVMVPVVDLVEIGNGGGSIAWVDDYGKLHVGPQSAGAVPGPAGYGKGGAEATTTDANLLLGRINKDYFCGGDIKADMANVKKTIGVLGEKLGVDVKEAARGIVRLANNNMVNALKLVSLNRGFDPRDFTLIAFGGGGGMHAVSLAQELGVNKIVIPTNASVFSAWGMTMSDLRRDYFVTCLTDLNDGTAERIETVFRETESHALTQFSQENVSPNEVSFTRFAKFRYQNQEHTTEVVLEGEVTKDRIPAVIDKFKQVYEREYTYQLDVPVEMVGIHLVAVATVGKLSLPIQKNTGRPLTSAVKSTRSVDYALEGIHETTIYDGAKLEPDMAFEGPAIIEEEGSTTVIHPGNKAFVDNYGNYIINI